VTDLLYSVVANPAIAGSELAEAQDNGTLVRSGSTSSFYQSYGGDGSGAAWAQATNGVSMASAEFDALVFNSGHNPPIAIFYWQDATNGLNLNDSDFFNALATPTAALDATGQVFYTCTTHYCYQTTNGGQSWGLILDAFTLFGLSVRDAQHSIGVSPIDTNHIAVAGAGGNLMLTINGGGGWSDVFMNGAVSGFQSFVSSPVWVNNSILYVGSAAPGGGAVRVAKSIDGGSTWSRMDSGLPDVAVMKLIVDPRDATGNTLYAGTLLGVYQTRNGGTSWQLYGSGLPIVQVSDIYMPANGTYMRVSTYGRGIWELPALTITTASLPAASLNTAYSQQLNATGGVPTYTWSISAGALPTGLTLSTSGLISGTPTVAGTYNFTVKVLDSSIKKQAATKALSIVVN
jgi:hypothetical protein